MKSLATIKLTELFLMFSHVFFDEPTGTPESITNSITNLMWKFLGYIQAIALPAGAVAIAWAGFKLYAADSQMSVQQAKRTLLIIVIATLLVAFAKPIIIAIGSLGGLSLGES